jgi:hypothetical protein
MSQFLKYFLTTLLSTSLVVIVDSCRKRDTRTKEQSGKAKNAGSEPAGAKQIPPDRKFLPKPADEKSREIEALTGGAHTRVVWNECQTRDESDSFSHEADQTLNGIDTRDGLGERTILGVRGNYSRPVLTSDGEAILYTTRAMVRKKGGKDFVATIYRTDWNGSPPVELTQGYVVDTWRDPATGAEWVYCVRKFLSVHGPSLVARQLWRFRLDKPKAAEVVYDDSRITPDNIQLSRDGKMACGQFPWPQGGVLHLDGRSPVLQKLLNGCWTSCAPDLSGVSWVFDGSHRAATFFAADAVRSWHVKFDPPFAVEGEAFHPRWTNHPRFMVLTGPYFAQSAADPAVHSDNNRPDVYLGRFNEQADKVEGWVKVSKAGLGKAYPDAWIAGGEKEDLRIARDKGKAQAASSESLRWPARTDGLLFLWEDRKALNSWKDKSGHSHTADLVAAGAARFGRHGELVFSGGTFTLEGEDVDDAVKHLMATSDAAFEASLLSAAADSEGWLLRAPDFAVYWEKGTLIATAKDGKTQKATVAGPVQNLHLIVNRRGAAFEFFVNGSRLMAMAGNAKEGGLSKTILLGDNSLESGMENIAIFDRALSSEEIAQSAEGQLKRLASLPPAPLRVRLAAKLVEISKVPTPESIEPYTSALICSVYEVEKVLSGEFTDKRVLVKSWGLLNKHPVMGLPHKLSGSYELVLEKESDHSELQGERVNDDTTAFDLTPWMDTAAPKVQQPSGNIPSTKTTSPVQ